MNKLRCSKCGAFLSEKNRYMEGRSTQVMLYCKKCKAVLTLAIKTVEDER